MGPSPSSSAGPQSIGVARSCTWPLGSALQDVLMRAAVSDVRHRPVHGSAAAPLPAAVGRNSSRPSLSSGDGRTASLPTAVWHRPADRTSCPASHTTKQHRKLSAVSDSFDQCRASVLAMPAMLLATDRATPIYECPMSIDSRPSWAGLWATVQAWDPLRCG